MSGPETACVKGLRWGHLDRNSAMVMPSQKRDSSWNPEAGAFACVNLRGSSDCPHCLKVSEASPKASVRSPRKAWTIQSS